VEFNKKILVVDDEPEVLVVLEKRLRAAGYEVIKAEDGLKALRLAGQVKPDVIVLDVDMPHMDGGEVAAKLKEMPAMKHVPVLFLTCLIPTSEGGEDRQIIGENVFMSKPYDPEELLRQIESLMTC
jgi:CheY-like chemotaxis protein